MSRTGKFHTDRKQIRGGQGPGEEGKAEEACGGRGGEARDWTSKSQVRGRRLGWLGKARKGGSVREQRRGSG